MRTLSAAFCALLCASAAADALNKEQRRFFENRRICVRRDTTTIPGSVISHYERNGKPDTKAPAVVTNVLRSVVGAEQKNHLQSLAEQLRDAAERWQAAAEKRAERLDALRAYLVEQRDAAKLPTTRAIYQALIDMIDADES